MSSEIKVFLTADNGQLETTVDQSIQKLDEFEQAASNSTGGASAAFDTLSESIAGVATATPPAAAGMSAVGAATATATAALSLAVTAVLALTPAVLSAGEALRGLRDTAAGVDANLGNSGSSFEALREIASSLGAPLADVVSLFESIGISAPDLDVTIADVINLTQALTALGKVGGDTSAEVAKSTDALLTSLADGTLSVQAINTALKNTPDIVAAIADGLGMTVEQLIAAAKAGEVLSGDVMNAILSKQGEISAEAANMAPNFEQATNTLSEGFQHAFGMIDAAIGATRTLNSLLSGVGSWLSSLGTEAKAYADISKQIAEYESSPNWLKGKAGDTMVERLKSERAEIELNMRVLEEANNKAVTGSGRVSAAAAAAADKINKSYADTMESTRRSVVLGEKATKLAEAQYDTTSGKLKNWSEAQKAAYLSLAAGLDATNPKLEKSATSHKAVSAAIVKHTEDLGKLLGKYDTGVKKLNEYEDTQADLKKLYDAGLISLSKYTELLGDFLNKQEGLDKATKAATASITEQQQEADPYAEAWADAISRVDSAFSDLWQSAFQGFDDFGEKLKSAFLQLLGELANAALTRPIMVSMGLSGSGSASAAMGGTNLGGFLSNPVGMVSGAIGGISTLSSGLFGGAGLGQSAMLASQTGAFGFEGAMLTGQSLGLSGIGSFAAAAAPFIAIAAALPVLNNFMKQKATTGGGIEGTASYSGFSGNWYHENTTTGGLWGNGTKRTTSGLTADEDNSLDTQIKSVYEAVAGVGEAIGLGVEQIYAYSSGLTASTFTSGQEGIDAAIANFGSELAGQYTKVFADLGTSIGDIFSGFTINSDNLLAVLESYSILTGYLDADIIDDYAKSLEGAGDSAYDAFMAQEFLSEAYDGSLESTYALASATEARYQQEMSWLALIGQMGNDISVSLGQTSEMIRTDLYSQSEMYDYLADKADAYAAELEAATDPTRIKELADSINEIVNKNWGSLDDQQKGEKQQEYLDYLTGIDELAQERLNASSEAISAMHDETADIIRATMDVASAANMAAAEALAAAAADMAAAAADMSSASDSIERAQFAAFEA